jgi:hypothetical protein
VQNGGINIKLLGEQDIKIRRKALHYIISECAPKTSRFQEFPKENLYNCASSNCSALHVYIVRTRKAVWKGTGNESFFVFFRLLVLCLKRNMSVCKMSTGGQRHASHCCEGMYFLNTRHTMYYNVTISRVRATIVEMVKNLGNKERLEATFFLHFFQ